MQPIVNIAVRAARKAGQIIIRSYENLDALRPKEKNKNDFVTEIDKQAEKAIIDTIHEAFPNHGILAEESGMTEGDETVWIIDPLDGTTNYIHGFPHFAISIGIQQKGRLEHGIVFDPLRQETFIASRGQGARLNDRRIRVNTNSDHGILLGTGFPYRSQQHLDTYLKTLNVLIPLAAGVRRAGSAALDLAYVAAGRLDGFWEFGLSPWDTAAGAVLIKEAGGLISDMQGGDNFLIEGNIVAGTPKIFKTILQNIRPCIIK